MKHLDIARALLEPFEPDHIRQRKVKGENGERLVDYITARQVMNRLDEVVGWPNWTASYEPRENCVICTLTIRLPDGTTVSKTDAGGAANIKDVGDDEKSAFSDAFKRAAVQHGIGRHLYKDGLPRFVSDSLLVKHPAPLPAEPEEPPTLLTRPVSSRNGNGYHRPAPAPAPVPERVRPRFIDRPTSGKAFWGWLQMKEEDDGPGLVRDVTAWAKQRDIPTRIVSWSREQVALAWEEFGSTERVGV